MDKIEIVDGVGTMFKFMKEFKKDWWRDFIQSINLGGGF